MIDRDYRDEIANRIFEETEIDLKKAYESVDITLGMIRERVEKEIRLRGKTFLPRLGFFYKDLQSGRKLREYKGEIFFRPSSQVAEYERY